jgi:predicted nucleic acid-binding protein
MRVVLDTNVLFSALISPEAIPTKSTAPGAPDASTW